MFMEHSESPLLRAWSEEPEEPAPFAATPVKEEPEEPAPLSRRGVVGLEDYVADVDAVAAAIAERSVREEAERRCNAEELEALQLQLAVAASVAANEKAEEWCRIRKEQAAKYVDLCSSGEED
ncbi:ABC transporter B family member 25 [Hordeum vulgare]|nr:ABC transporter B family member 25 [Hordeum vulgare]